MASIAELVEKLKIRAVIRPEERLTPTAAGLDDFLEDIIGEAVKQHNPDYSVATLPAAEEQLVLLLAQVEICYVRASMVVNAAPTQAAGQVFTQAIDSPFKKNMALAAELIKRYDDLVLKLGVTSDAATVIAQTTVYKKSDRLDILFPAFNVPYAPAAILYASAIDSTTVHVNWDYRPIDYFYRNFLFWSITPNIYDDANSVGVMTVPRIRSSARFVDFDGKQQENNAVQVSNLPSDTDLYFILVTKTQQAKYTFSDEVMVHTPA